MGGKSRHFVRVVEASRRGSALGEQPRIEHTHGSGKELHLSPQVARPSK